MQLKEWIVSNHQDDPQDLGFTYVENKDGDVRISRYRHTVKQLRKKDASRFLGRVSGLGFAEQQIHMARITGQYKFGNERLSAGKRAAENRNR